MTKTDTFENSFWDRDITSTNGWERLTRRMKDGRKVCQDISQFYKDRSKIESDYCKSLLTLAKKAEGSEETGGLGNSWLQVKIQTEGIAKAHEEAAKSFQTLADRLTYFNDEQKKIKQQHEDAVKKLNKNKFETFTKTMNLKKSYETRCREYETADQNYNTIQNTTAPTKKDIDKLKKTLDKAKENVSKDDLAYKTSIESLEKLRVTWEASMEAACKEFQRLEFERLTVLRNILWQGSNVESLACVLHDNACEIVRVTLETCDVNEDIQAFIESNKSGHKRPEKVEYENYYKNKIPTDRKPAPKPRPPALTPGRAMSGDYPTGDDDIELEASGYASVEDLQSEIKTRQRQIRTTTTSEIEESHYAAVDLINSAPSPVSPLKKLPLGLPKQN